jgi:hypothetical protein
MAASSRHPTISADRYNRFPIVRWRTFQTLRAIDFGREWHSNFYNGSCHGYGGGIVSRYRLNAPITAILDKRGGQNVFVKIPAGAILREAPQISTALLGMVGVYWENRQYSVSLNDLFKNAERVEGA